MIFFVTHKPVFFTLKEFSNGKIITSNNEEFTQEEFSQRFKSHTTKKGKHFYYEKINSMKCASLEEGKNQGKIKCNMPDPQNNSQSKIPKIFQENEMLTPGSKIYNSFIKNYISGKTIEELETNFKTYLEIQAERDLEIQEKKLLAIEKWNSFYEIDSSRRTTTKVTFEDELTPLLNTMTMNKKENISDSTNSTELETFNPVEESPNELIEETSF